MGIAAISFLDSIVRNMEAIIGAIHTCITATITINTKTRIGMPNKSTNINKSTKIKAAPTTAIRFAQTHNIIIDTSIRSAILMLSLMILTIIPLPAPPRMEIQHGDKCDVISSFVYIVKSVTFHFRFRYLKMAPCCTPNESSWCMISHNHEHIDPNRVVSNRMTKNTF